MESRRYLLSPRGGAYRTRGRPSSGRLQELPDIAAQIAAEPRLLASVAYLLAAPAFSREEAAEGLDGAVLNKLRPATLEAILGFFDEAAPAAAIRARQMLALAEMEIAAEVGTAEVVAKTLEVLHSERQESSASTQAPSSSGS